LPGWPWWASAFGLVSDHAQQFNVQVPVGHRVQGIENRPPIRPPAFAPGPALQRHFAGGQHNDLLKQIPPGDNYLYFTEKRGHPQPRFKWRGRYWSFLLKLSPDLPSWTIQARRSNNMGPFHWRNRILRIEEIKRLQTFPDAFELAGTTEQQWRQIGNAVPPMLAQAVARQLADHLGARLEAAA